MPRIPSLTRRAFTRGASLAIAAPALALLQHVQRCEDADLVERDPGEQAVLEFLRIYFDAAIHLSAGLCRNNRDQLLPLVIAAFGQAKLR